MIARAVPAVLLAAVLVAGCGVGAGDDVGGVSVRVTRDFGATALRGSPAHVDAPGGETAMRALQRRFTVRTRYGGGFVQSIDGLAGGTRGGRPVDWFFYVNGVEAPRGAASTQLHRGDAVWWDRHDWGAANRVPAVVGSFPEPFAHGIDGRAAAGARGVRARRGRRLPRGRAAARRRRRGRGRGRAQHARGRGAAAGARRAVGGRARRTSPRG